MINKNFNFKIVFKKRCFTFSIQIIQSTKQIKKNTVNVIIINQLVRSATSIGANVVENECSQIKKLLSSII